MEERQISPQWEKPEPVNWKEYHSSRKDGWVNIYIWAHQALKKIQIQRIKRKLPRTEQIGLITKNRASNALENSQWAALLVHGKDLCTEGAVKAGTRVQGAKSPPAHQPSSWMRSVFLRLERLTKIHERTASIPLGTWAHLAGPLTLSTLLG